MGCLQAVVGQLRGREVEFKVTPKVQDGLTMLPLVAILPYLLVALVSLLPALLVAHASAARGYYFWSLFNGLAYSAVLVAVLLLHARENRSHGYGAAFNTVAAKLPATVILLALFVLAVALHGNDALQRFGHSMARPVETKRNLAVRAEHGALLFGVTTKALADNEYSPWRSSDLGQLNSLEGAVGTHVGIVSWFVDWAHGRFSRSQLDAIAARGSIPEITWEPWNPQFGYADQPAYSLRAIYEGRYDNYIRAWAIGLKHFGKPVRLRFAQEMNIPVYPWGARGRDRAEDYVRAWRHVHDIMAAVGADNVRWVWAPVAGPIDLRQYPGNNYVDVIGLSGYNGGTVLPWGGWRSFATIFSSSITLLHRMAPAKPIEISETASAAVGGSRTAWIDGMFQTLRRHPEVTAVDWFDVKKEVDWRLESSISAIQAVAGGLRALATTPRGSAAPAPLGSLILKPCSDRPVHDSISPRQLPRNTSPDRGRCRLHPAVSDGASPRQVRAGQNRLGTRGDNGGSSLSS